MPSMKGVDELINLSFPLTYLVLPPEPACVPKDRPSLTWAVSNPLPPDLHIHWSLFQGHPAGGVPEEGFPEA